ncbi:MAG: serine hydrolase domain-containing protein [Bacteroidota bacterium]
MYLILKRIWTCVLILMLVMGNAQSKEAQKIIQKYDEQLKEQKKGTGVLMKKNNYTETYALGEYDLNSDKVFSIGSATKTFTAILILQEMEKGNLKLSDSIGTYLRPINNVEGSLSIGQLLSHESGLDEVVEADILSAFFKKDEGIYNQNLLDRVEAHKPENVGTFQYLNTNYLLLGAILERITDQHYFDLLRERIFKPLELNNTYAYLHKNINNLATPTHKGKDVSKYIDHRFYGDIPKAAGSIASTLSDMEKFYFALFETEKLLKKETLELMLSSGNDVYGLGIFKMTYKDRTYYGHGGNNIGYAFSNAYDPKTKALYLVYSNNVSIPIQSIEDDLNGWLNDEPIEDFKAINIDLFKSYAGTYLLKEANMEVKVVIDNDKMYLVSEAQGLKSELSQKDENTLIDQETGVSLTKIENDPDNLTFSQQGFSTVLKRVKK